MLPNVATLPITVGVGAFLVRERGLLVVRKTYGPSKGQWTIPSGYVERHESIVQSVERGERGDEHRRSDRLAPRGPKSRHGSRERHVPRLSSGVHIRPTRAGP